MRKSKLTLLATMLPMALPMAMVAVLFLGAGCAKKNKPDSLSAENTTVVNPDQIASKDMDFALQGSDSGQIAGLYSIHFEYDKSALTQENRDLLSKNADWLKNHPAEILQIEGHCDRHGSTEYNLALGERRAKTVKAYMANLGVSSERLTTISYGKEKMIDTAESELADGKNRRANFHPINSPAVSPMSQR